MDPEGRVLDISVFLVTLESPFFPLNPEIYLTLVLRHTDFFEYPSIVGPLAMVLA